MEWMTLARAGAALVFVVALMLLVAQTVRRFGLDKPYRRASADARLAVLDSLAVDGRHRLVLVRRDSVGHLLLLGQERAVVVESGIALPAEMGDTTPGATGCV